MAPKDAHARSVLTICSVSGHCRPGEVRREWVIGERDPVGDRCNPGRFDPEELRAFTIGRMSARGGSELDGQRGAYPLAELDTSLGAIAMEVPRGQGLSQFSPSHSYRVGRCGMSVAPAPVPPTHPAIPDVEGDPAGQGDEGSQYSERPPWTARLGDIGTHVVGPPRSVSGRGNRCRRCPWLRLDDGCRSRRSRNRPLCGMRWGCCCGMRSGGRLPIGAQCRRTRELRSDTDGDDGGGYDADCTRSDDTPEVSVRRSAQPCRPRPAHGCPMCEQEGGRGPGQAGDQDRTVDGSTQHLAESEYPDGRNDSLQC